MDKYIQVCWKTNVVSVHQDIRRQNLPGIFSLCGASILFCKEFNIKLKEPLQLVPGSRRTLQEHIQDGRSHPR